MFKTAVVICSFNCLIALEAKCCPSNGSNFIVHVMTCTLTVYGVYFMPLKFHEFHELFWIHEIKFLKCCRNVIAILVAILKFLVKTHEFVKI